jgi:hypothetical protein
MDSSIGVLLADGILNYIKSLNNKDRSEARFFKQTIDLVLAKSNSIAALEYKKGNISEINLFAFKQKIQRTAED